MRTQTTLQLGDRDEHTKLLNQFRGLVWSCHNILEGWPIVEVSSRLLVYQMQEFKEKWRRGGELLVSRLFRTLVDDLYESLKRVLHETGKLEQLSFSEAEVAIVRALIFAEAERAITLLERVNRYVDEVPELAGFSHHILKYQKLNGENHLLFKQTLDKHGLTPELEKLAIKCKKG